MLVNTDSEMWNILFVNDAWSRVTGDFSVSLLRCVLGILCPWLNKGCYDIGLHSISLLHLFHSQSVVAKHGMHACIALSEVVLTSGQGFPGRRLWESQSLAFSRFLAQVMYAPTLGPPACHQLTSWFPCSRIEFMLEYPRSQCAHRRLPWRSIEELLKSTPASHWTFYVLHQTVSPLDM